MRKWNRPVVPSLVQNWGMSVKPLQAPAEQRCLRPAGFHIYSLTFDALGARYIFMTTLGSDFHCCFWPKLCGLDKPQLSPHKHMNTIQRSGVRHLDMLFGFAGSMCNQGRCNQCCMWLLSRHQATASPPAPKAECWGYPQPSPQGDWF